MKRIIINCLIFFGLLASYLALADETSKIIVSAESAAPIAVTFNTTIKAPAGTVLRKGSNSYTCYPQQETIGPMCIDVTWETLIHSMMNKKDFKTNDFGVSYILAGEETAPGVSNSDPYGRDPAKRDDWVKEGPHLMIIVPDRSILEGLSTNPKDPVYVMWKDT